MVPKAANAATSIKAAEADTANEETERKRHSEWYSKYRNGPSKLSMISLAKETVLKSLTITVTRDAQNRYLIDDFVADCSVSGGGKWYFEVTFVGQCQYCCAGFIDRKYRKTSNSGISNEYEGRAWCIVGPNTQYMHRGRNQAPTPLVDKGDEESDDEDDPEEFCYFLVFWRGKNV